MNDMLALVLVWLLGLFMGLFFARSSVISKKHDEADIARDVFGNPKKAQIIKKKDDLDILLEDEK